MRLNLIFLIKRNFLEIRNDAESLRDGASILRMIKEINYIIAFIVICFQNRTGIPWLFLC